MTYTGYEKRRADAELAFELARANYHREEPFFLFSELMQRTLQALNTHRFSQAVLSLGTAVEVMIAVTTREASRLLGEPANRADSILAAGIRNVVHQHLGRYANISVDLADAANPAGRWWQVGYRMRNRVAHEGYKPTQAESEGALDSAMALVAAVRDGLRAGAVTAPLGKALQWGLLPDSPNSTSAG